MNETIFIALGGAFGSVARYWAGRWTNDLLGHDFPYGTLVVNVLGSLAIGVLFVLLVERGPMSAEARAVALVGFFGAFTTFSTFSLDTVLLIHQGALTKAAANAAISLVACIGAAYAGYAVTRQFAGNGI